MKTTAQLIDEGWIKTDNHYGKLEVWEKEHEILLYDPNAEIIVNLITTKDLKNENQKAKQEKGFRSPVS